MWLGSWFRYAFSQHRELLVTSLSRNRHHILGLSARLSDDMDGMSYDFFFLGILAPDLRASLSAIATACLRLVTFLPLPDFNVPSFFSFITL